MKKGIIKHFLAVTMTVVMMGICTAAYADNILDKYTPKEDFEYSDEMIGHALKAAVPRIYNSFMCTVKYNKLSLNTQRIESLVRANPYASENQILEYLWENIDDYISANTESLSDEFTATGSGVAISDDGYIATNQHVISTEADALKETFAQSGYIEEDAKEFVMQIAQLFGANNMSEADVQDFYQNYVEAMKDSINISVSDVSLTVVYPDADGNASLDAGIKYPAQIIKEGRQGNGTDIGAEDAAILKIDAKNIISLPLAKDYPAETTKIFAAGYPGVSNSIFEATENTADTLTVTITNGIVSRVVPLSNSNYKMIQTTATVNQGNSGGPSVDSALRVTGLNTLLSTLADGYYWMVPSEVLRNQSQDLSISQGNASEIFMLGLQALQEGYGATAKECFEEVKQQQPNTPYINKLIERAASAPQTTMKRQFEIEPWMIIIAVAVVVGVLLVIIIVKAAGRKKKYKRQPYMPDPRVKVMPPYSANPEAGRVSPYPPNERAMPVYPRNTAEKIPPRPVSPPPLRSTMPPPSAKSELRSTMPTLSAKSELRSTIPKNDGEVKSEEKPKTTMWTHGSSDL